LDDATLLRRVLELPNTTVAVVLGSKDKVVPPKLIHKFLQDFETVPVVELEGLGHDAFEEDVEAFMGAVEQLLGSWEKQL
jgi:pimeloyl-ACP methyl ester carboxylesterase